MSGVRSSLAVSGVRTVLVVVVVVASGALTVVVVVSATVATAVGAAPLPN